MKQLPRLALASDELEALRLVDMQGLQQQQAAQQLGVSRQTLGNIIARGRHKVAQALVMGMALELAPDSTQTTED
ncbi:hypothetical protein PMAL9190_02493 [Photobacterium malacitanum]|uniref:Uncharacterized protein n=2 Tax=Photobacterium malacitanum TaxID=2204294 RepID=A0A1Y6ML66_9GAMM|nr:hypothetical protein PMAL9190_02493 [Photobacterium malacitanum]